MRKINTRFFFLLVFSLGLCAGGVYSMHRLQAGNIAEALLWQANQAEKDGKLPRAAKYLGRYLEFRREDLDEREHLGMILSDPRLANTHQRRARARFVIEQVLAKDPHRHGLRQRLAENLIAGRSFTDAKEHLNYLEKHHADSAEIPYLVGLWHEAQGQPVPAVEAFRRAIRIDAGKTEAYVRLVNALKRADFGKEARHTQEIERLLVVALEKAPTDPGVLSLAAQHAQEQGNARIALKHLEEGLKHHPGEPRLYLALAQYHGQDGKRSLAIDKLRLGLKTVPKDQQYELRWSLANLLIEERRLEDARRVSDEVREVNPLSAQYLDARRDMARGRWFEAARLFEKIRPSLKTMKELAFQIDLYLGACYEQLDEPALQLTAFQRAASADPTSMTARRGMANASWALGNAEEALRVYQELIARTGDGKEAAKRRVEFTRLLLQSGRYKTPVEKQRLEAEVNAVEKASPGSPDAPLLRAECLFLQGDRAAAETLLNETIKSHPQSHELWLMLVSVSASKTAGQEAKALMRTAEARFKGSAEFRLGQIRFWAKHFDADAVAGLKRLEDALGGFTQGEQSALLQALAEAYYDAGRYGDSERALRRMLRTPLHALDMRIHMQLFELALIQNDMAKANSTIAAIKKIEGDGGVDGSFGEALRIIRLERKASAGTLERARHLLTVASAQRPGWHPIVQARAELDERQGRPDQAIANYRRALDLGSRDPLATKQLLILLSQAQRFDEVEEVLARLQKKQGTTDQLVRYYVAHSYNRRDLKKAEYLVKQVVASNSANYRDHLWMGQILSAGGQSPAEAEKALRRAVALAKEQPETWINLVRHLIGMGQYKSAKAEMDQAGDILPSQVKHSTLAQCAEMFGMLKDAVDHHQKAVEASDAPALALRAAAEFHLRIGSFVSAEALFRKLSERQQSDADLTAARRGLALSLVKQRRPPKTAEALRLVGLTLDARGLVADNRLASDPIERLLQAKVLGSMNHHALRGKAIAVLESIHQKAPLVPDDQFFLARLLARHDQDGIAWAKTRLLLKGLMEQFPKNARYLVFAGHLHVKQKEFTAAEAIIKRLERVERERQTTPGGFGSIELRAKMLELRGMDTQAIALLTDYAAQTHASPIRLLLVANLQGRLGNFREAIDLCERVAQAPGLAQEGRSGAVAILRDTKPSEALLTQYGQWREQRLRVETSLREAIATNTKDIPSRLFLAALMEMQGKHAEVETICRGVLKDAPNNLVALNNLAWLLAQKPSGAAEALPLVERAIKEYGPRPELIDTRAVAHLNLGNNTAALSDLERVVNEAPTPTRLFHLSRVYEKSRNLTLARATFRRASDLGLSLQHLHPAEHGEYQRVVGELRK